MYSRNSAITLKAPIQSCLLYSLICTKRLYKGVDGGYVYILAVTVNRHITHSSYTPLTLPNSQSDTLPLP